MKEPQALTRLAGSPLGATLIAIAGAVILRGCYQNPTQFPWYYGLVTVAILFQTAAAVRSVHRYKLWREQWDSVGQFGGQDKQKPEVSNPQKFKRAVIMSACVLIIGGLMNALDFRADLGALLAFLGVVGLLLSLVYYCVYRLRMKSAGAVENPEKELGLSFRLQLAFFLCASLILLAETVGILDAGNVLHWTAVIYIGAFLITQGITALRGRSGFRLPSLGLGAGRAGKKDSAVPVAVTQCLNVPQQAPSRAFAEANLPEYAARLLNSDSGLGHQNRVG
jgi:hypothetical protein